MLREGHLRIVRGEHSTRVACGGVSPLLCHARRYGHLHNSICHLRGSARAKMNESWENAPLAPQSKWPRRGRGQGERGEGLLIVYVRVGGFVYPEPLSAGQRGWLRWSSWNPSLLPRLRTIMTRELLARNKDKEYCHVALSLDAAFGYPKDFCYGNRLCFSGLL